MRSTIKPLLVAGLVAVVGLAACSDDDGGDNPLGGEQAAGESEDQGGGDQQGTGGDPDAEPLGTTRAQLDNLDEVNVPLRIDVVRLVRNGELVELGMVLTNEASDDGSGGPGYQLNTMLGGGSGGHGVYDIREVGIVDPEGQRIYLPAVDDQDQCRCTETTGGAGVDPGESLNLDATIGGLPEDVTTVDVHVPGFPPIVGMEVAG